SVHEEDRPKVLTQLDDVLHRHQDEWNIVFRAVRPDKSVVWMHGLYRATCAADDQVTRMSGINLDIMERRRIEEVFQVCCDEERDRTLHKEAEEVLCRSYAELEQRTMQLRRLAFQLTLTEQSVRKQFANTFHDGLQQLLFSAGMTLEEVAKTSSKNGYQAKL